MTAKLQWCDGVSRRAQPRIIALNNNVGTHCLLAAWSLSPRAGLQRLSRCPQYEAALCCATVSKRRGAALCLEFSSVLKRFAIEEYFSHIKHSKFIYFKEVLFISTLPVCSKSTTELEDRFHREETARNSADYSFPAVFIVESEWPASKQSCR
ncbi:jg23700 [Pararge aegeria aegeria]|uniref:Jg23700 protein n=1 Tax=Pararge aegeria aegeria TaxID=348720 RepID=A0A8S4QG53_9NEOP|nr:jg23700 [Pararge aegeria aegeria]